MVISVVHNPIQNKWFNNLSYLSKQIYVGVIWKSDVNMPFVVISTNRKAVFEYFYRSQNLKCCLISKSSVVFLVYICLFSQKTEDYATKEYNLLTMEKGVFPGGHLGIKKGGNSGI
jgi:hypothetical protein